MTLAFIILGIFYCYTAILLTKRRLVTTRELARNSELINGTALDRVTNFELVKLFGRKEEEVNQLERSWAKQEKLSQKSSLQLVLLRITQDGLLGLFYSVFLILCSQQVVREEMSIGELVMSLTYIGFLTNPLEILAYQQDRARQAFVDMEGLLGFFLRKPTVKEKPGALPLNLSKGEISFHDVSFRYTSERPIISNLSFHLAGGGTLAFMGKTGSGKTTLARLLLRFYDPKSGVIKIDGQDISQVTLESLWRNIGVVPQEGILFNESLWYNLTYGVSDVSYEDVQTVVQQVKLEDFLQSLPHGYDTPVGEKGFKLSGGERQRIALARALIKKPKILVLDEATSALDMETEQEIYKILKDLKPKVTCIIITHRLGALALADKVLVLTEGRIKDRG